MLVKEIVLKDFRNYENLELSFDSSKNIFIGENGQGKTNILEAIFLCAFARSFKTNIAAEMIRFNCESASVKTVIESEELEKEINIILHKSGKKMIKKDGKILNKTTELLSNLIVIIFSPEDLRIIKDNPEKRRYFIDREICQIRPKYQDALKKYNDLLKQKNALLKEQREDIDIDLLDVYDEQLAELGKVIIKQREEFIKLLGEKTSRIQKEISGGREELVVEYKKNCEEGNILERIKENRERDIFFGYSGTGPHRDDIEFFLKGKEVRKYGSQGQQRTVALALKLAEIEIVRDIVGENPVLLLDDVLSELDENRQKYLLNEIENVQIFVTTTEKNSLFFENPRNISIFNVSGGTAQKNG